MSVYWIDLIISHMGKPRCDFMAFNGVISLAEASDVGNTPLVIWVLKTCEENHQGSVILQRQPQRAPIPIAR